MAKRPIGHVSSAVLPEQRFEQAVSRLAQYRPFAHGGRDVQAALRDLVLSAAAEAGGGFDHLGEAKDAIKSLFNLEIEIDELRGVIEASSASGVCVMRGGGFWLSDATFEELTNQAAASRQLEERAFADWQASVRQIEPELSDEHFEALRADLDAWLERVVLVVVGVLIGVVAGTQQLVSATGDNGTPTRSSK